MNAVLRVTHRAPTPGLRVVQPAGEAAPGTAETLRTALDKAVSRLPAPHTVVVDCSRLVYCTAAGLDELLLARSAAAAAGIAFRLSGMRGQPARLLQLTGAGLLFEAEPVVDPAPAVDRGPVATA